MGDVPTIIEFPAWRFHHETGRSVVVDGPEADAALKEERGWSDTPPPLPEPPAAVQLPVEPPSEKPDKKPDEPPESRRIRSK